MTSTTSYHDRTTPEPGPVRFASSHSGGRPARPAAYASQHTAPRARAASPTTEPPAIQGELAAIRQRAEQLGRTLAQLVQSGHQPAATTDSPVENDLGVARVALDGRFLNANRRFGDLTGYTHRDLLATGVAAILHADDRAAFRADCDALRTSDRPAMTACRHVVRPDGTAVPVHLTLSLVRAPDDTPDYFVLVMHACAGEQCLTCNPAAGVLAQLPHAVSDRLAQGDDGDDPAAIHDALRMLRDYMVRFEHHYRAGAVYGEIVRTTTLIEDLLAYTSIMTRPLADGLVNCDSVVTRASAQLRMAIADSNAFVSWRGLPTVRGDGAQLATLFQQLIANALRFRRESPLEIRIRAERRGDMWQFAVQDTGSGIPADQHAHVFELFTRASGCGQRDGNGLGLAICKAIVERHGGAIWFESTPGQGSTFCFTLPADD